MNKISFKSKFEKAFSTSALVLLLLFFVFQLFFSRNTRFTYKSKAAGGKTISVSGNSPIAIQQAIDSAADGDIISIPAGIYSGPQALPIGLGNDIAVSKDRGGADTCMVRIEGKTITLKGAGMQSVLYGEGHDKPYLDPYQYRAGLCVINGGVVIESMKLKEFQKRCLVSYNSTVIIKNSTIEGCDEGGASLLGNSSGLFVNNYFFVMNFGGIMLWQNSTAKVINNTFYGAALTFFFHPGTNDQARADIKNNIFYNAWIGQVGWWAAEASRLNNSAYAYDLVWKENNGACDTTLEYCTNFTGKISVDPMFTAPVFDPRGMAAWSDMTLQSGSPALGAGDPSIPGTRNIGITGGPCADPTNPICDSFIAANMPSKSVPTLVPTSPINPTSNLSPTLDLNPTSDVVPTYGILPTSYVSPTVYYTPAPTPTLAPNQIRLNLNLKLQGVVSKPKDLMVNLPVKITVSKTASGAADILSSSVPFLFSQYGAFTGAILTSQITPDNYILLVKPGKHLQRKICDVLPSENTPGSYQCSQGSSIPITVGENNLDLTGVYLFAGDINQDGIVDSADVATVIANLGKTTPPAIQKADLNFDNVVDSQDYSLVIQAIKVRFDDEK